MSAQLALDTYTRSASSAVILACGVVLYLSRAAFAIASPSMDGIEFEMASSGLALLIFEPSASIVCQWMRRRLSLGRCGRTVHWHACWCVQHHRGARRLLRGPALSVCGVAPPEPLSHLAWYTSFAERGRAEAVASHFASASCEASSSPTPIGHARMWYAAPCWPMVDTLL